MASVRSMLRDERASRRITHPHLTYSTTGILICQVCNTQIKTEALWNKHLQSAQHAMSLQRMREAVSAAPTLVEDTNKSNGSKKRKADDDSSDNDIRKKTKGESPSDSINGDEQETSLANRQHQDVRPTNDRKRKHSTESSESPPIPSAHSNTQPNGHPSSPSPPTHQPNPINEDEWAAFQRDLASPSPPALPEPSALTAAADISAAPMTAAELAAQSREQASRQAKERMEAELEGEKEDAARRMEEELEEMAELEDRVRRLREKREALRVPRNEGNGKEDEVPPDGGTGDGGGEDGGGSGDDSDEEEDDEWNLWGR
ncbi:MAG: hypothetical protein Q9213_004405 [Squamulea squamosa]